MGRQMREIEFEEWRRRSRLSREDALNEAALLIACAAEVREVSLSLAGYWALESLAALTGFDWLEELDCSGTSVSDLVPLSGLSALATLDCSNTSVSDLAPLSGLSALATLNCSNT